MRRIVPSATQYVAPCKLLAGLYIPDSFLIFTSGPSYKVLSLVDGDNVSHKGHALSLPHLSLNLYTGAPESDSTPQEICTQFALWFVLLWFVGLPSQ